MTLTITWRKVTVFFLTILATVVVLSACTSEPDKPSAQSQGQALTERAYQQQSSAVPYPVDQLRDSLERRNIRAKLLRENQPNRLQYVYLTTISGDCLGFYAIKGKVSSNDSQMTTDQLVQIHEGNYNGGNVVVTAPGDDGSYGPNEPGVFFFTTEGVMVKTNLPYMVSDAPLPFECKKLNAKATQEGANPVG